MRTLDYVMYRESRCNPSARNRSGATGLLQLMPMHWRGKFSPTDPYSNLAAGHRLYMRAGWSPWQVCGFHKGCKGR